MLNDLKNYNLFSKYKFVLDSLSDSNFCFDSEVSYNFFDPGSCPTLEALLFYKFEIVGSNGLVTLFEVTENFWRLSRTARWFKIFSQKFDVNSAESLNHA